MLIGGIDFNLFAGKEKAAGVRIKKSKEKKRGELTMNGQAVTETRRQSAATRVIPWRETP